MLDPFTALATEGRAPLTVGHRQQAAIQSVVTNRQRDRLFT